MNKVYNGYQQLYTPDGSAKWMSLSATTDSDGINPYLKTLFNAINKKDNDQDITLNNHGDLIQWILKHLHGQTPTGTDMKWLEMESTAKSDISSYSARNTMYYYARPVQN